MTDTQNPPAPPAAEPQNPPAPPAAEPPVQDEPRGTRVKFRRSFDQQHELTGRVVKIGDDGKEVLIKTDPDGVLVWANYKDVRSDDDEFFRR
jgi:hypothetical protein